MIGRLPLWATLLPLVTGVLVWAVLWTGYARRLEATIAGLLPAGAAIETSGFPYRLVARAAPVALVHSDVALEAALEARSASVNRVPWQIDRQVINLEGSVAALRLKPIAAAHVRIEAPSAQASLRLEGPRIARLSAVWEDALVQSGLLPVPLRAERLEAHFRETPAPDGAAEPKNPRLPTQDQLVISGKAVRIGGSDPLSLELESEITAAAPVSSLAAWARDGTVEIAALALSDATGEVARLKASVVPDGQGGLVIAGTIETVCPASVRAALAAAPPPSEKRTRKPVVIPFEGEFGARLRLVPADPSKPSPPVRGQEPDCPRLR